MADLSENRSNVILQYIQIVLLLGSLATALLLWVERTDNASRGVSDLKHQIDDIRISIHDDMTSIQTQISGLPDERALLASLVHQQSITETALGDLNKRVAINESDIYKIRTDENMIKSSVEDLSRASSEQLRKPR